VLFMLTALITVLMGSAGLLHGVRAVRYVEELCLLLIWISALVIAVTTTARQLPAEREHRTLFPLLAKPVTRTEVILGKALGCWVATGLCLVVFYLFFGLVSAVREQAWPLASSLQALWLHWWMLAVVVAMSLLGSLLFATPAANATVQFLVAGGILLVGRHLNTVALGLPEPGQTLIYGLYFAIPHLELFDVRDLIVHDWAPVPWWACAAATLYAAAYAAAFLVLAAVTFRRQPLQ